MEIDFVLDGLISKSTLELKFSSSGKKVTLRSLIDFSRDEGIANSYLINLTLYEKIDGIHYLPAYLISKIKGELG